MKGRNESLDCLKGIAILLVMFGHVQVHNQMTDPYLYDVIKSLQMPLFFLISGYLAGAGTKIQNFRQYAERMKKRAVSYLLPFFAWLLLQHAANIPEALRTVMFQLDYGLWFLMVLFLFTWLAYSAQLAEAKAGREAAFWGVWLAGCALVLAVYLAGITFLSPSILVTYLPYYTAAYAAGRHPEILRRISVKQQRICAYAGGVIFLGMAAGLDLVTVTGDPDAGVVFRMPGGDTAGRGLETRQDQEQACLAWKVHIGNLRGTLPFCGGTETGRLCTYLLERNRAPLQRRGVSLHERGHGGAGLCDWEDPAA